MSFRTFRPTDVHGEHVIKTLLRSFYLAHGLAMCSTGSLQQLYASLRLRTRDIASSLFTDATSTLRSFSYVLALCTSMVLKFDR